MSIDTALYVYSLAGFYLNLYAFAVVLLLAGTLLLKAGYQKECCNFLYVCNTLAAWVALCSILYAGTELFSAWYGQQSYEWNQVINGINAYPVALFFIKIYFTALTGILFFIKQLRINRFFTLLFLLMLNLGRIETMLYSLRYDDLPSSWAVYNEASVGEKIFKYLLVVFFVTLVYLVANKKKKLPHPSVFLK